MVELSVVVPMHDEESVVDLFFDRLEPVLSGITEDYEVVCVNDGSGDGTLERLIAHHRRNGRVKVIDLSRNFGKEYALSAGIDYSTGRAVIPIDADLQDPPELIPDLVTKWREGYEMVLAVRTDRRSDSFAKRTSAGAFYRLINRLSDVPLPANAGDFRLMERKVVNALGSMRERGRYMKGMFAWLGFRQAVVTYSRPARAAGRSKWQGWKLWNFALEGIISFTSLPLRVWSYFGLAIAGSAFVYALYIIVRTLIYGIDVPGYASLAVLMLFLSGMILIGIGVIGEYLARIFVEVKQRPLYLVRGTYGQFEQTGEDE
jgi:glycosyltransferase involved in cell wall biosynthesis